MPNPVALIDAHFGQMVAYYRTFSSDETWAGHIEVAPRDVVPFAYGSFEALLTQIRDQQRRGRSEFLIGTHGYPDGLPYPIIAGTSVTPDDGLLDQLGRAAGGSASDRSNLLNTLDDRSRPVFKDDKRLGALIDLIRDVRSSRIEHLEIRGCNLGSGPGLKALHLCLNSKHTVAPTVTFMSGMVMPSRRSVSQAQYASESSRMGQKTRSYLRSECNLGANASGTDTEALTMRWTEVSTSPHLFTTGIAALSPEAAMGWTKTALENSSYHIFGRRPPGGGYRNGTPMPLIGMWTPNGKLPFVFPGDGFEYLNQLAVENTP